ncbi:MAG TPA: CoA pyrophosphatase [Solirubrobacteraceae bacterium]|nr:CoA pyrophosphatase [Solirubrobacteraceae bacterium]
MPTGRPDPSAPSWTLPPDEREGQTLAAVLVPLIVVPESDSPHVVLTKRRDDLRRHAGEVSFPGGRRDPDDADLSETALREAEEEIGLARGSVELLGELSPISTFATNYLIHPFVGQIAARQRWAVSPREVDIVLELPLRELQESRTRTPIERRGITFETDAYIPDGNVIWGATFRILENLLERLQASDAGARLSLA